MKRLFLIATIGILSVFSIVAHSQSAPNTGDWKPEQLYSIDTLAAKIAQQQVEDIYIINTGPVSNIPHALQTGAVEYEKNLKKLVKLAKKLDKKREVIIYCGCCPLAVCPNLEPAYTHLLEKGFKVRVLALIEDLETDWVQKGYPLAAEAIKK